MLHGTKGRQRHGRSRTECVEVHKASAIATSARAPSRSGIPLWMTRSCVHVRTHTNTNTVAVSLDRCHVGTCWEHSCCSYQLSRCLLAVINERTRCDAVLFNLVYCAQTRSKPLFSDGTDSPHSPIHSHAQRKRERRRFTGETLFFSGASVPSCPSHTKRAASLQL